VFFIGGTPDSHFSANASVGANSGADKKAGRSYPPAMSCGRAATNLHGAPARYYYLLHAMA